MTIHSTDVIFKDKTYKIILEDGLVSFVDPELPEERVSFGQPQDLIITTLDGALAMGLQMIEKHCSEPILTD
jgi:hypothetical protein